MLRKSRISTEPLPSSAAVVSRLPRHETCERLAIGRVEVGNLAHLELERPSFAESQLSAVRRSIVKLTPRRNSNLQRRVAQIFDRDFANRRPPDARARGSDSCASSRPRRAPLRDRRNRTARATSTWLLTIAISLRSCRLPCAANPAVSAVLNSEIVAVGNRRRHLGRDHFLIVEQIGAARRLVSGANRHRNCSGSM